MGMSAGGHGEKAVPYINVTPLIDVLLVLLIIFMVVTPLKPSRFKTLVPEPPDPNDAPPTKAYDLNLRVDISKDMKLHLNGEEIGTVNDTSKLSQRLARLFQERTEQRAYKPGTEEVEKTVYIKAPRSIAYGEVAKVIDSVKGSGAAPVGLQVDALEQ